MEKPFLKYGGNDAYACGFAKDCWNRYTLEEVRNEHGEPAAKDLLNMYCKGRPELCPDWQGRQGEIYKASAKLMTEGHF